MSCKKKLWKFFWKFFPKGSCKFCYSWSNKTYMVIQITCLFKKFSDSENFSKFFQRDHPSFVTPRVTRFTWSSQITCHSNFFFFHFFLSKGSCYSNRTHLAWSSYMWLCQSCYSRAYMVPCIVLQYIVFNFNHVTWSTWVTQVDHLTLNLYFSHYHTCALSMEWCCSFHSCHIIYSSYMHINLNITLIWVTPSPYRVWPTSMF